MTVSRLATKPNLDNIPHMLRYWADAFERGEEPMPETVLLMLVDDHDSPPGAAQRRLQQCRRIRISASHLSKQAHFLADQRGFAAVRVHRIEVDHVRLPLRGQSPQPILAVGKFQA